MATTRIMPLHVAKAAQRVGRSVTSSTMWPIQRKQITAGSLPAMRVTAEQLMRGFGTVRKYRHY